MLVCCASHYAHLIEVFMDELHKFAFLDLFLAIWLKEKIVPSIISYFWDICLFNYSQLISFDI